MVGVRGAETYINVGSLPYVLQLVSGWVVFGIDYSICNSNKKDI